MQFEIAGCKLLKGFHQVGNEGKVESGGGFGPDCLGQPRFGVSGNGCSGEQDDDGRHAEIVNY
jgi:hypothetical protein